MLKASAILQGPGVTIEPPFDTLLEELLDECRANLPKVDEDMLRRAFRLAHWAHRNDRRASGEPYVMHPIAVARIVAQHIRLDDISVGAALLHDVVEDTAFSIDFIREEFGRTMGMLIDGLTKIGGVFSSRELGQAENVRKLMLSMAQDIRVILVKFADRLHNMQTIESLPRAKQLKAATETQMLYAPLAHRFGLQAIKNELEDLSLRILDRASFDEIVRGLQASRQERESYIRQFIGPLNARLLESGFEFDIYGRSKNVYSIFCKMKTQNKPLNEIYDVFAIRVVLKSGGRLGKEECWRVYSIITDLYKPLPERFRDFISVPKSNGYRSLHTTVLGPQGRRIEVQIRTQEMHEVAERGVAAHWKYKEGIGGSDARMDQFLQWVRDLMENPHPEQATEFVQEFNLNLYTEEIYVFTPKGDLRTLPSGASPIDFAFQIHTDIGYQCIGAKVNGKMVPLSHVLRSGDQVEIITSKKKTPNPDWIKFVVTHKARSRIRHWINVKRREAVSKGRGLWKKKARRAKLDISESELLRYASKLRYTNVGRCFTRSPRALGRQRSCEPGPDRSDEERRGARNARPPDTGFLGVRRESGQQALLINGERLAGVAVAYASCCNPIPGDAVFGYASRAGTINIHRTGCRNASNLLVNHQDRIHACDWSRQKDVQFIVGLRVRGEDRVGIVNDLTTVISRNLKTNIQSITVDTEDGIFEGTIVLYVSDLAHLQRLIRRLKNVKGVHGVYRFEG